MKRKLLSLLALLCLTVTSAWADDSGSCGTSLTYSYVESTHTLTISGSGAMTNFDSFGTKAPWDGYKASITSVVIGSGVTTIGDEAFYNCSNLASVSIPASVLSIGAGAFSESGTLAPALQVTIADGSLLSSIGISAFSYSNLTSFSIPASVKVIDDGAFLHCSNLTAINVADDNTAYCSDGGVLFNKDKTTLIQYPIGKTSDSYVIPDDVKTIGDGAFTECGNLVSVTMGNDVETIGNYAFDVCQKLATVNFSSNLKAIGFKSFGFCESLTTVNIPASVTSIADWAFVACSNLATVTLNSNPFIDEDAFTGIAAGAAVTMNLMANSAGGAKWSTFYNKLYSFEADANTQVFKAELIGTTLTLHDVTDKIVDAGTGVVLKTSGGGNPVMTLTTSVSSNSDANSLEGVSDAEGQTSDGTMFVLNYTAANGVGFYKLKSGETLGVGKAYLTYSGALAPEFLFFDEDCADGISLTPNPSPVGEGSIYNLAGQRIQKMQRGINIVNGKKIIK